MVKICQTGLLKLNFEIMPKKHIFRFWPKISAGHGWSLKFFFATFQILGPLGCQGWVVIPQNVKKSQNHCTLVGRPWSKGDPGNRQCSSGCNSLQIREKYLVLAVLGAETEEAVNANEEAGVEGDGGQQQQHPERVHVRRSASTRWGPSASVQCPQQSARISTRPE